MTTPYQAHGTIDTTTPCGCEAVHLSYTPGAEGWPSQASRAEARDGFLGPWVVACVACGQWAKGVARYRLQRRTEISGTWRSNWTEKIPAPFVTWYSTGTDATDLGRTDATHTTYVDQHAAREAATA